MFSSPQPPGGICEFLNQRLSVPCPPRSGNPVVKVQVLLRTHKALHDLSLSLPCPHPLSRLLAYSTPVTWAFSLGLTDMQVHTVFGLECSSSSTGLALTILSSMWCLGRHLIQKALPEVLLKPHSLQHSHSYPLPFLHSSHHPPTLT